MQDVSATRTAVQTNNQERAESLQLRFPALQWQDGLQLVPLGALHLAAELMAHKVRTSKHRIFWNMESGRCRSAGTLMSTAAVDMS